ncbi:DUF1365 domain-containing protein [Marinobacter sp. OP 3.4]|uniref:DUF1365 domain-containing protein n=1 Tax=Marinobacter sp. OP 3.4 TaxID=3076501 RepID=UPI002E1DE5DD
MSAPGPYASSWLSGTVRHRRHSPVGHGFRYHTGMLALDLDEWSRFGDVSPLVSVGRFNWMSLRRGDYLDPEHPDLRQAVADRVERTTGWRPDGPVELITHPRYFGYVFNPVSFYFCYRTGDIPSEGAVPAVILAQITNTPWHQRHVYCLEVADITATDQGWRTVKADFAKRFHVSPFNPMDQDYRWTFSFRGPELRIHMNVNRAAGQGDRGQKIFDATLVVQRTPITRKTIHSSLRRFPLESFRVIAGIYWHALRLRLKGVPFHTHPDKLPGDHPHRGLGREDRGKEATTNDSRDSGSTRTRSWRT